MIYDDICVSWGWFIESVVADGRSAQGSLKLHFTASVGTRADIHTDHVDARPLSGGGSATISVFQYFMLRKC